MFFSHWFAPKVRERAKTIDFSENFGNSPFAGGNYGTAKPLIIFGDFNTGKTWFVKRLLQRMNIKNDTIASGGNIHTRRVKVYQGQETINANSSGEENHHYALCDTEGFNKPLQNNEDWRVPEWDPIVCSIITKIPGLLIYMTNSYNVASENMLKIVTALVPVNVKIVVIHNRYMDTAIKKESIIQDLLKNKNPEILRDNDGPYSFINNHTIRHLFLFQHRDIGSVSNNEQIEKKILLWLKDCREIQLHDCLLAARDCLELYTGGLHDFTFNTEIGTIEVNFRILDNQEESIDLIGDEDITSRVRECSNNFRVIEIRGPVNLDRIKFKRTRHFITLKCQNYSGVFEAKDVEVSMWTPMIVVESVHEVVRNNAKLIYVRVVA